MVRQMQLPPCAKVAHAASFSIRFNIQAEVVALEQSLATVREEGSQALASAREQMAQQLAHASDLEATRVELMRRQGELAVVRAPHRTPHTAHSTCTMHMHHALKGALALRRRQVSRPSALTSARALRAIEPSLSRWRSGYSRSLPLSWRARSRNVMASSRPYRSTFRT